jgi:MerR family transcriptional regulator, thiopeptide resistance regulator
MDTIRRVIALLVYDDIPAAHDFLVEAFGFTPGSIHRDAEGRAVHGEVRAGDLEIWLHRAVAELRLTSPCALPGDSSGLVVHVDDVDAHYEHARAHGARVEGEPSDQPYGQREYGVTDPEGHRWWFAAPLK